MTSSSDEPALGGHLEPGTTTYTLVIVTLGVLPGTVDLQRLDNTEWR